MKEELLNGINNIFPVDYRSFRIGFNEHVEFCKIVNDEEFINKPPIFPLTCQVDVQTSDYSRFPDLLWMTVFFVHKTV